MVGKLRNMTSIFLSRGEKLLLLYRQGGRVVNDVWVGSAGGHFEEGELNDAKACVLREMQEELGLSEEDIGELRLKYIILRRAKGEIRQNYYFFAELKPEVTKELSSNEGRLQWFSPEEIRELPMPHSAHFAMEHYLAEGRQNDSLYAGVADADGVHFWELLEF